MGHKTRKHVAFALALSLLAQSFTSVSATDKDKKPVDLKLWYNQPAANTYDGWERNSLPLGNSAIGASVFGRTDTERIQLTEKSLWNGGPSEGSDYNGGNLVDKGQNGATIKKIQQLFLDGKADEASRLCNELIGAESNNGSKGYGFFLSFGNLYLDLNHNNVTNYERDLNLENAIANVRYTHNGVDYTRENFVSYEDNVLVTRLTSSKAKGLDLTVRLDPDNNKGGNGAVNNEGALRSINKKVKDHQLTTWGEINDNKLKYVSHTKVVADGAIVDGKDSIRVDDASVVTIYTSLGTDYKNDYPNYRTGETTEEVHARIQKYIDMASSKAYETLKQEHIDDYRSIYGRVTLDIGQQMPTQATDVVYKNYREGKASEADKRYLETVLFQYGRYLTIASSREAPASDPTRVTLPSNLQGIWNGSNNPDWHGDYHLNVNLQMNYWPTYSTNMAECAKPLIDYVDSLREPGRVTAEIYAGVKSEPGEENGFMAHTQNTPFGWTAPGWVFDWGWSPAAVPWILQNCYEYYEFTGDKEYLLKNIYPMLREEARLYDQMLIRDNEGKLVSAPAYSPEHGPRTLGNTYEHTLIWQLYEDAIFAANTLGVDSDLVATWTQNQKDLKGPIEIGTDGQIKEWYEETTLNSVPGSQGHGHRHLSHMLGLFPGDLISQDNKELFDAARVSMENRTDSSTGWGMGQRINTWARLRDGNKAYKLIGDLFKDGLYDNLWDRHNWDAFQIDGNFGYTSGVAEMLLQSNQGYIDLLPALPDAWANGHVSGLVARGNYVVDMDWENKDLAKATITSRNGGKVTVNAPDISTGIVSNSKGEEVATLDHSADRISFDTVEGETYTISHIEKRPEAPTDLQALRVSDDEVEVSFKAFDHLSYRVFRQIGDGDVMKVADIKANEQPLYKDTKASTRLGDIQYYVQAIGETGRSDLSEPVSVTDGRTAPGYIDNADPRIVYKGTWGNWTQEAGNYNGTIQYTGHSTSGETAELSFTGTGIAVIVCTNNGYGHLDISVDGKTPTRVDLNSAETKRQVEIFKVEDLANGRHTITLTTVDKKVELDAFKVFNKDISTIETIEVVSANGQTVVGADGAKVQLQANITPTSVKDPELQWTSSNEDIATVDEHGLVTFKDQQGDVTIEVAAMSQPNKKATIKLSLVKAGETTDIVEDGTKDPNSNGGTKNPAITYAPEGQWSLWSGDAKGSHSGDSKTETGHSISGDPYIEYTFNGTGIEVYAQKHKDFGGYKVSIDGKVMAESVSLNADPESFQAKVFEAKGLENGEHTIRLDVIPINGKVKVNLDFFKVFKLDSTVDKTLLQEVINEAPYQNDGRYEADKWKAYYPVYKAAIDVMNNLNATNEHVSKATTDLQAAIEALGKPSAKPVVTDTNVEVLHVESSKAMLTWTSATSAESYRLTDGNLEFTTSTPYIMMEGLAPNTEYTFTLYAVNGAGEVKVNDVSFKTIIKPVFTLDPVTNINHEVNGSTVTVTWDPNVYAKAYKVSIDGMATWQEVTEPTFTFEATENTMVSIKAVQDDIESPVRSTFVEVYPALGTLTIEHEGEEMAGSSLKLSALLDGEPVNAKFTVDNETLATVDGHTLKLLAQGIVSVTATYEGEHSQTVDASVYIYIAANNKALASMVSDYDQLVKDEYTKESWSIFEKALASAKELLGDIYASQSVLDAMVKSLEAAKNGLVMVSKPTPEPQPEVDKQKLMNLILEVGKIDLTKFTKESVATLNKALESAQAVIADGKATQKQVDDAYAKLLEAKANLVKVEVTTPTQPAPETGDSTKATLWVGACVVTMVAVVYLTRKRKMNA